MMIPAGMVKLDEPDVALGQAPGQQAVRREGSGLARIGAVKLEDMLRLFRQVGHFGNRRLHPVGHLVLSDAGIDFGIERRPRVRSGAARASRSSIFLRPAAEMPGGFSR